MKDYLFTSERLGFRNWTDADVQPLSEINADPKVMEYFPQMLTREETAAFIERMQRQFNEKGFCYFAVDTLERNRLIGFIGISEQTFESAFTPCLDIGWRLHSGQWGRGYATEGSLRCLRFAFEDLDVQKVIAIAPVVNQRSERVMQKLGMRKVAIFEHPKLMGNERLRDCVLYEKQNV